MVDQFTGEKLRKWRTSQKLSQSQLAELINDGTRRHYKGNVISAIETGKRGLPQEVQDFLFGGGRTADGREQDGEPGASGQVAPDAPAPGEDRPPRLQADTKLPALSGAYAKTCEELFDMVGFAVLMIGNGLRRQALAGDGLVIQHNKRELGVAYGKLAERNETFRRFLIAMTEGSVWTEIIIVTAKVGVEMGKNHVNVAYQQSEAARTEPRPQPPPETPQPEPVVDVSDGNVQPSA